MIATLAAIDWDISRQVAFGVVALVMIVAAVKVVTSNNIVHAALYLVVVLAGVAVQFILLGAEFVAVTQVLVYIGAVIVLFLFGIMLTRARLGTDDDLDQDNKLPAILVAVLLLGLMVGALIATFEDAELPRESRTTAATVSDSIFSEYIIAFEAVSVLLLAALIGAIVVARRE